MTSADLQESAAELRRAVTRLGQRLRQERPTSILTGTQLTVLGLLHRHGESTPGQIARSLRLQPQSLTRTITDLERAGLVQRRLNPADRRESVLSLSTAGAEALSEDMHQRDNWLAEALGRLGATELGVLALAAGIIEELAETP